MGDSRYVPGESMMIVSQLRRLFDIAPRYGLMVFRYSSSNTIRDMLITVDQLDEVCDVAKIVGSVGGTAHGRRRGGLDLEIDVLARSHRD